MSIDDKLGKLLQEFKFRTPEGATPKGYDEFKQALYKDMVELIDSQQHDDGWIDKEVLRTKLKEYFGVKE